MDKWTCRVCGGGVNREVPYLNSINEHIFNKHRIFVCEQCGFGEIAPKVDPKELDDFYANSYRSKDSCMHIDFENLELNPETIDFRSLSQLLLGRQYMKKVDVCSFLDIGAGSGTSFLSAKKLFPGVKLFVLEMGEEAKLFYQRDFPGISVVEDLKSLDQKIDMVLMSHSLEHFDIDAIPGLLSDVKNILDDNGVFVIEVPYADMRDQNMLSKRHLDTPHLSFFSYQSLGMLAKKCGFEVCFINTAGNERIESDPIPANGHLQRPYGMPVNIKKNLRKFLKLTGIWRVMQKIRVALKLKDLYQDCNFQYAGERDLLRCVLRKKED